MNLPARRRQRARLRALADNARRRLDAHSCICARCARRVMGEGQGCAEGRDLERDARQATGRAA